MDTILSVPETENSRVRADLIKAAMKLPGSDAARLAQNAIAWIDTPYNLSLHETIGRYISYLASSNEVDRALQIARALLAITPRPKTDRDADEEKDRIDSTKPETRVSFSDYRSILEDNLANLTEKAGDATIELLCQLLAAYLKASPDSDDEYSYIWRPAIESHEQNHDDTVRELLISAIRDSAESLLRDHSTELRAILKLLRGTRISDDLPAKPSNIIERLCLHLMRLFPTGNESEVAHALTNEAFFEDHRLRHEYALLLKERFKDLSQADQNTILTWIDTGPSDIEERAAYWSKETGQPPSAEEIASYKTHWQLKQLVLIHDSLPEPWAATYAHITSEIPAPEHPEFESYMTSGYVGHASPRTLEDLKSMPPSKLREFLKGWTPEPRGSRQGPSRAGLGKIIEEMVSLEPTKYIDGVEIFYGLDPTYVRSFLEGIGQALGNGTLFPWTPVLDLCHWAVNQNRTIRDRIVDKWSADTDWGWTRARIARLLSAGFNGGPNTLRIETRARVWSVLSALTEDPDPTTEDEANRSQHNEGHHLQHAINTVRGKAMEAVIEYGLWVRRCLEADNTAQKLPSSFTVMPEVREVLDKHLEYENDHSLAIRAVYGTWFPWLALLDREWATNAVSKIFPPDNADSWNAAWEAYILYREPYNDVLPLLTPTYRHAITKLRSLTKTHEIVPKIHSHLAQHLMVFYWRGLLEIEPSGLIAEFFACADDGARADALKFLGRSAKHMNEDISPELPNRLLAMWNWRFSEINQNPASSLKEASAFGWWFGSGKFDFTWSTKQLINVLRITGGKVDPDYLVMEQLVSLPSEMSKETIECAFLMVEGDKEGWDIHSWTKELRHILGIGSTSKNPEVQKQASVLINRLGERGYLTFRDLLPRN
ncbi:MAG: hypothetical protein P0120_00270 [Nitrospira sp.]|nr:hypothetical protein [Nitrospira sp.]